MYTYTNVPNNYLYTGQLVCYNTYTMTYNSLYVLTFEIPTTYNTHTKKNCKTTYNRQRYGNPAGRIHPISEHLITKYLTVNLVNDSIMQFSYISVHAYNHYRLSVNSFSKRVKFQQTTYARSCRYRPKKTEEKKH